MKPLLFLSLACALLSPVAALAQAAPAETEILHATSGVFGQSDDSFRPTRDVSLAQRDAYGWIIQVRTDKPVIRWREEFTLPARASNWGVDGDSQITVADDGRTSVTEREVEAGTGWIANAWAVADGDPKGRYVMRVTVDGGPSREFQFDVQ
ncbi:MAG: hypothetical protein Q7T84_02160 [Phenylobacterium sp.]|uniref:hypothetical protein n=1 Tax=Phenylobacterium sp. TaxID=1871053 RepID=UPI002716E79D|nr:hypothetical protein [Phenylobacterium sp.]MDO9430084.1 hypothetical protein [Phenylobacterium sp.]